jgi:hypothetical protein
MTDWDAGRGPMRTTLDVTKDILTEIDQKVTTLVLASMGCEALHTSPDVSAVCGLAIELQDEVRAALKGLDA